MSELRGRSPPPGDQPQTSTSSQHEHADIDDISAEMHVLPEPVLSVLKTKAESRAQAETIQVWFVELPAKAANNTLILCKESIPNQDDVDLQHLRRFIKPTNLPVHLLPPESRATSTSNSRPNSRPNSSDGSGSSSRGSSKSKSRSRSRQRRRRNGPSPTLLLLVCPVSCITHDGLITLLNTQSVFAEENFTIKIKEITVPLLAPTSIEQAQQWSMQYWPTTYRKTNPYGPHPNIVIRAEEELGSNKTVGKYMAMAYDVASESKRQGTGIGAGCVVVERREGNQEHIVAVAGDARCCGTVKGNDRCTLGNVAAHAVLRAIGMVARKRVRVASPKPASTNGTLNGGIQPEKLLITPVAHKRNAPESVITSLLDYPLTASEQNAFDQDNLIPNGYLCVDLEIYLTHEPCLMCSMAIVHSRFGRCIFGQRMPASGGMSADSELGYGLFWRSELNWKLLCWEYSDPARKKLDNEVDLSVNTQV